jgi:hypothetical protein
MKTMNRITPTLYVRSWLLISGLLLAAGCEGSSLGPGDSQEVSIRLEVTGGFAGVDYAFTVDGAEGVVRAERCVHGCDFQGGDILLHVSPAQVENLSRMLLDAGLMQADRSDYGIQCCDQLHFDLEYRDAHRQRSVRGSSQVLPGELSRALAILNHLSRGWAPVIVAFDTGPEEWPQDALTLNSAQIRDGLLTLQVSYSGGCVAHYTDLVAWGGWLESEPVQVNLLLAHDDRSDSCEADLTESLHFDLWLLREAYESAYGGTSGRSVVLRLRDPAATHPPGSRLLTYTF